MKWRECGSSKWRGASREMEGVGLSDRSMCNVFEVRGDWAPPNYVV